MEINHHHDEEAKRLEALKGGISKYLIENGIPKSNPIFSKKVEFLVQSLGPNFRSFATDSNLALASTFPGKITETSGLPFHHIVTPDEKNIYFSKGSRDSSLPKEDGYYTSRLQSLYNSPDFQPDSDIYILLLGEERKLEIATPGEQSRLHKIHIPFTREEMRHMRNRYLKSKLKETSRSKVETVASPDPRSALQLELKQIYASFTDLSLGIDHFLLKQTIEDATEKDYKVKILGDCRVIYHQIKPGVKIDSIHINFTGKKSTNPQAIDAHINSVANQAIATLGKLFPNQDLRFSNSDKLFLDTFKGQFPPSFRLPEGVSIRELPFSKEAFSVFSGQSRFLQIGQALKAESLVNTAALMEIKNQKGHQDDIELSRVEGLTNEHIIDLFNDNTITAKSIDLGYIFEKLALMDLEQDIALSRRILKILRENHPGAEVTSLNNPKSEALSREFAKFGTSCGLSNIDKLQIVSSDSGIQIIGIIEVKSGLAKKAKKQLSSTHENLDAFVRYMNQLIREHPKGIKIDGVIFTQKDMLVVDSNLTKFVLTASSQDSPNTDSITKRGEFLYYIKSRIDTYNCKLLSQGNKAHIQNKKPR
jgi:hypothetical protein